MLTGSVAYSACVCIKANCLNSLQGLKAPLKKLTLDWKGLFEQSASSNMKQHLLFLLER